VNGLCYDDDDDDDILITFTLETCD